MADESHILSQLQAAVGDIFPVTPQSTVGAGILHAVSLIRSRFEGNRDPDYDMPYHCVDHTVGVIRRTAILLAAMHVRPEEIQLGMLGGAFHDTVQNWEANTTPDGRVLRKRFTGQNEADSAAEGVSWMRTTGAFQELDYDLITKAIMATVPGWDPQNGTVSQPNLPADAAPVVRAVAMADLAIAGMEGREYVEAGEQLFREENLDVGRAIRSATSRNDLPAATLEGYKTRMLTWCRSQVGFARGRLARLNVELGNLDGRARAGVISLFSGFDEAIRASEDAAREREPLPPWEVARAMGYAIPG